MAGRMAPEEERKEFFFQLGFAISQWVHVEAALSHAFAHFVEARNASAATRAFFAAISFSIKLDMTNAAAAMCFFVNKPLKNEWDILSKQISSKSRMRNFFAHNMPILKIDTRTKYRYHLEPNVYDLNYFGLKNTSYNVNDVRNEANSFAELAEKITDFIPKIVSARG